jgi:glycogen debranching enzyme
VAKHGNLYLLTDPRGDVRIDGRGLGLYELDTRVLSTSTLRLNGVPLTLLRGPYLRDGLDTIQLTNPELRRNPEDKHAPPSHLRNRELSVTRTRRLHGELSEQVAIVNYSPTVEALELQLGLGVDMADIFEVRGYARPTRGRLLPIELSDERVDFGYVGLDGVTRITTVGAEGATVDPVDDPTTWPGASVLVTWRALLEPNARVTVGWTVTTTRRPADAAERADSMADGAHPVLGGGSQGQLQVARPNAEEPEEHP